MVAPPASHTSAHDITTTVAPFRAWRGSQSIIAKGPTGVTIKNFLTRQGTGNKATGKRYQPSKEAGHYRGFV